MSAVVTRRLADEFLARLGAGDIDAFASLFSSDLRFDIPGDVGALPWIGKRTGRQAAADFLRGLRELVEPLRFEVRDILANERRAVILGELASRSRQTGKTVESPFAIVLTVANGEIGELLMFEDSYAVSRAARP
ncbi:nuclear transport factor 2 family protein [Massilia niastensis]|uniref:nuclear transport factor 2 family protein n=1 Tax=Massilia niastensis TaxID=544911 RepID=UPI000475AFBC|nr:nuclear transport factor 2 family protein [Massilia niastensis]